MSAPVYLKCTACLRQWSPEEAFSGCDPEGLTLHSWEDDEPRRKADDELARLCRIEAAAQALKKRYPLGHPRSGKMCNSDEIAYLYRSKSP